MRAARGYMVGLLVLAAWLLLGALGLRAQDNASVKDTRQQRARDFVAQRADARGQSGPRGATGPDARGLGAPRAAVLTAPWQPLGPAAVASASFGKVAGRVTAVALDPNDASGNTLYVGTTGGGVWKSTNAAGTAGGVTFAPLTDTLPVFAANAGGGVTPSLSIGAVAVQSGPSPVVLAGTGDPNDATDSYYGEGILRSADGGATWTLVQGSSDGANGKHSFLGLSVAGMAWSGATPSLVVAGLSSALEGAVVDAGNAASVRGLYYSRDAGATWQMATVYDGASVVQQPLPLGSSDSGNAATAVVWDALRGMFFAAVRAHGFYQSADGATWTRLANQPGAGLTAANCPAATASANCPLFRGALAVQAATGDLYALSVDAANRDNGLWQDVCAATAGACAQATPAFATRIDAGALEAGGGSTVIAQGDYDLALRAVPDGTATDVFVGTIDLYRCALAAGASACVLRNTTNALNGCNAPAMVAPAMHAIDAVALASGGPLVFVGNDGGLWRSTDGVAQTGAACSASDAAHFDNLNGALGSLAEVVGMAQSPSDADVLLAGLGANGTAATTAAASAWSARAAWAQLSAGEGGLPAIDATQPMNWYAATGAGVSWKQCTLGSACAAANFAGAASVGSAQVAGDAALLDAPTLLDPALTASVLTGTCRLWRGAASGAGWSAANAISKPLGGGSVPCSATSALVRSVAAGGPAVSSTNAQSAGSTVLYAGMAGVNDGGGSSVGGHVFVTTAANTASNATQWTDVARNPVTNDSGNAHVFNPFGFDISAVVIDAHDATGATVYATVMGFGGPVSASPHVYRSVDFGAHWLNVSANLPDAPANALVVDPNDANTVYVALDSGVYATTAVTTCVTANCWSVLGTALPQSPVMALAAGAQLATGDGRRGMLRAGTYGRGLWQTPLLTAIGLQQPALTLSATMLAFAAQQVATQSAAQTVTVTSSGNAPLTVSAMAVSGDFVESDTCVGQAVAVGATCSVQVQFAPAATGTRGGSLTIYANIAGGQATLALSGIGTNPAAILLTPAALSFAATVVNQASAAQNIAVQNTGGTASALQTPVVAGDFAITANTCGALLAAQTACAVSIAFVPTASGNRSGTFTLTDDAGTQVAQLSGVGSAPATDTLTPLALSFTSTQTGTRSTAQNVTLTNSGDVALTLVNASVTSGPFVAASSCGTSLAGHASCAVSVTFVPSAPGTAGGVLSVSDQFQTQAVSLTGIGVAPAGVSLTPAAGLTFPATGVGLSAPPQTMTLTNNGGVALTIASIAASSEFQMAATTCGSMLTAGSSCTLSIIFSPTAGGMRTGVLTLTDNGPTGSQSVALSGVGVDFGLVLSGPYSMSIASGGTAVYAMQLTAPTAVTATAALACAGAPAHATCVVSPGTVTLGGTASIVVTVQTGLAHARNEPLLLRAHDAVFLALLLPFWMLRRRRSVRAICVVLVLVSALLGAAGCGSGRQIPAADAGSGTAPTPTPSGTYALTVTASSAGIARSATVSLTVQ